MSAREGLPRLGDDPARTYRLGVMGGTFDPIHNGHLVAAEQVAGDLDLDVVLFMPAGSPAFKQDRPVSAAEDRFAMTLLATADNPVFEASRLEVERPGVTYTADTLEELRAAYPGNVELFFVTGADAIIDIVHWHDAARIASLATLVGVTRPGYDLERRAAPSTPRASASRCSTSRSPRSPSAPPICAAAARPGSRCATSRPTPWWATSRSAASTAGTL